MQPTEPIPRRTRRIALPDYVRSALVVFTVVSSCLLALVPHLLSGSDRPPLVLFCLAGLIIIGLTAMLFGRLRQLGLPLPRAALGLAFGYSALVVIIKLVLSPDALYAANQHESFSDLSGSPNSPVFFLVSGGIILLLYLGVFRGLYYGARRRVLVQQPELRIQLPVRRWHIAPSVLVLPLIVASVLTGGATLLVAYLAFGSSIAYLGYVFGTIGVVLAAALIGAIVLAREGFSRAETATLQARDMSLLSSFFWLGFCLILAYHIMWVVFMLTLVQLWPFKTYSPK